MKKALEKGKGAGVFFSLPSGGRGMEETGKGDEKGAEKRGPGVECAYLS